MEDGLNPKLSAGSAALCEEKFQSCRFLLQVQQGRPYTQLTHYERDRIEHEMSKGTPLHGLSLSPPFSC